MYGSSVFQNFCLGRQQVYLITECLHYNITVILLKVALNTIKQLKPIKHYRIIFQIPKKTKQSTHGVVTLSIFYCQAIIQTLDQIQVIN